MVRSARIERATDCLEGSCSIQLSYERMLMANGLGLSGVISFTVRYRFSVPAA